MVTCNWTVKNADTSVSHLYKVSSIPATYLVDRKQKGNSKKICEEITSDYFWKIFLKNKSSILRTCFGFWFPQPLKNQAMRTQNISFGVQAYLSLYAFSNLALGCKIDDSCNVWLQPWLPASYRCQWTKQAIQWSCRPLRTTISAKSSLNWKTPEISIPIADLKFCCRKGSSWKMPLKPGQTH